MQHTHLDDAVKVRLQGPISVAGEAAEQHALEPELGQRNTLVAGLHLKVPVQQRLQSRQQRSSNSWCGATVCSRPW